jgi:error-prone DNA polymerase
VTPEVKAILDHELKLIGTLGYAPYFLTVNSIVAYARSQDILCQGRGSAANSAVCYVLGITSIDPERNDLLFERFVSQERDEPPDIDVDFEHGRRETVMQWVFETYGRHRSRPGRRRPALSAARARCATSARCWACPRT